jgi:hypothetical protein
MQLDFEEIDEPLESNDEEPTKNIPLKNPIKKSKISYDDILTSLNLKVNNGKLEYIQPKTTHPGDRLKTCYKKQPQQQQQPIYQQQPIPTQNPYQSSYIFNKYFKDYKDPSQPEEEPVFLSPQEYKRQVILEMIRRNQERKRIAQIKSKKMLFAQNNPTPPSYSVPTNNINKLFRLLK